MVPLHQLIQITRVGTTWVKKMTIQESTVCSLIQSFPILLILAQNNNKCLQTPFVYKPPTPTHSPEYYEALDALFQSLYGHGYPSHHPQHGCDHKKHPHDSACHGYHEYGYPTYGSGYPATGYHYTVQHPDLQRGHSSFGAVNATGGNGYGYKSSYGAGPGQVYHVNRNKYKIVIKKNGNIGRRPSRRRPEKLILDDEYGGFSSRREDRRFGNEYQNEYNRNNFQTIPSRLSSVLHFQQERPGFDSRYVYPFQRRQQQNNNNYPQYGNYYPNEQQQQYGNYANDRPQWDRQQQNNNPVIVVEEITESPKLPDSGSFGDRYGEETTTAPDALLVFGQSQGQDVAAPKSFPTLPSSLISGTDAPLLPLQPVTTLSPLTPVPDTDKRSNFNFGSAGLFKETCETPEGSVGSCVSLVHCEPYLAELKMARTHPEIVPKLRKAHCGFEGENPKVCCPRRGIPTNTEMPTASTVAPSLPPPPTSTEAPIDEDQYVDSLPDPPVCGSSNASFSRVVGGVPAKLGDFPWLAMLGYRQLRNPDIVGWLCGGSIITKKHVLTASHCYHTERNKLTLVRLGELDRARDDDGATPIDINIRKVIEHEDYDPNAYLNDIAILLLEQEIPFTDLIKPICLPKSQEIRQQTFEGYTPLIAGWGELEYRGMTADLLQVVQLPVTTQAYCKKAFAAYKAQKIDERVLCAGYEKGMRDACRGDSGGPLMQPIWNKVDYTTFFYQIGVVSFGKKCAEPGFPGVYTRVTTFMPWIEKVVLGTR